MSKKRILHILYNLERGGAQEWLVNIIRQLKDKEYQVDVLIFNEVESAIKDMILGFGSKIILCPNHRNPLLFSCNLYKILNKEPKYDAVHTHSSYHAGIELFVARMAGIPIRINHIRCDLLNTSQKPSLPKRIYQFIMRNLIKFSANKYVGVCDQAGKSMFGTNWLHNKKSQIVYSGIDFNQFNPSKIYNNKLRDDFKVPQNTKVIGHIGRFNVYKNHELIINVFYKLTKIDPNVMLILVGDGELLGKIKEQVISLNLQDKVIFTGIRQDIPEFISNLFDVFFFPSISEGLGRVLIEAQATGIPCLISNTIPQDTIFAPELIHILNLNTPIEQWVSKIQQLINPDNKIPKETAYQKANRSHLTIERSVEDTLKLYQ